MSPKRLLYLWLGLSLVAGCDTPSDPGLPRNPPLLLDRRPEGREGFGQDRAPGLSALGRLARFKGAPVEPEMELGKIGPEGGSLSLGDFEIVVPRGAVDRPTTFKIRRPVDRESRQFLVVELAPHDVTFKVPVTIRLPIAGTTAENGNASVVFWTGGDGWAPYPSVLIEGGRRIEATVRHFSFWAVWCLIGELSSGG